MAERKGAAAESSWPIRDDDDDDDHHLDEDEFHQMQR